MPTNTPNYKLVKPMQEEFYNVDVPNNNMDIIDRLLKEFQDAITSGATEQELTELREALTNHLAEKASLTKAGHVQLSNKTNGTSETLAITEKALKEVFDALNSHAKPDNHLLTHGGILTGNINFDSPTLANKVHVIGEIGNGSTNPPPESYGILTAPTPLNSGYDVYEYTVVTSGNKYYKVKTENGWKPWVKVLTNADVRPSVNGTYTGNGVNARKIELGFTPSMVTIFKVNVSNGLVVEVFHLISEGSMRTIAGAISQSERNTYVTTGGFIVENVFANTAGHNYKYSATP